ncbi:hypothetical protein [Streptosporangium sp. KLBMP 9127]|nr:hypothetical protein [Streptosporangium sp. KLBMP 9127]
MTDTGLLGGRYRLLERLGWAWRARDELLHRDVAITEVRLPPPSRERDELVAGIRATAALRHPDIVTTHDVLSSTDRLWVVQELVEGPTLAQALRTSGPLPARRVALIGLRVLAALTAAGMPHGGLTPNTVILTGDDGVAVIGFGLVSGTVTDDLHALGALLFTAVEGHAPDRNTTPISLGGTPLSDPHSSRMPSGPLAPLLYGLLDDDPAHRPDARSVRLTLQRVAPPGRRHTRTRLAALAGTLLLAAAFATTAVIVRPAPPARLPGPGPTSADPSVSLPSHFAAAPDPCKLITREQAAELSLAAAPEAEKGECRWRPADDHNSVPSNLRYSLWLQVRHYTPKFGDTAEERARVNLVRFRQNDLGQKKSPAGLPLTLVVPPRDLPGTGHAAYTFEATNTLSYNSAVVLRVANVIVAVQYERAIGKDPRHTGRAGAHKTARWVLESLAAG